MVIVVIFFVPVCIMHLHGKTALWEAGKIVGDVLPIYGTTVCAEFNFLRRNVLATGAGFLSLRRINLILAIILLGVIDVIVVDVMSERRLVAEIAG